VGRRRAPRVCRPRAHEAPYEIESTAGAGTRLTVVHELEGAALLAAMVAGEHEADAGGGWAWVLCDLKLLLETGKRLAD
jgi:hypothetical protein